MAGHDEPQYRLAIVAELVQVPPDTIRRYERQGLVHSQKHGGERLYSERSVVRIRRIVSVTGMGVNTQGADVVCNLLERLEQIQSERDALREQLRRLLD